MRSLRGRLTLGVAAVLAVVLAVCGVSVSRYVARTESDTVDERLQRTAELSQANVVDAVQQSVPLKDTRLEAVLRASGTSLRVTVGKKEPVKIGQPPPGPPSTRDGLQTVAVDGRRWRVLTTSLRDDALAGLSRFEVTTRLERLEARQQALDRSLLIFGALALVLASVLTFLFANLLLRPLRRLRRLTASIVGDEDLARRVPADEGPGELRALAASFDEMLQRLARSSADRERALEATRRFAADAGHELRTPLTSVQANLSSLRRHPELDEERRNGLLDHALSEQQRLVALLDGLQALARGDAEPLERTCVDLAELLDTSLEAVETRHPRTTWERTVPEDPVEVEGWAPGLRLVLDNLLENAARHGRPGGTVRVRLEPRGPVLTVEDDGRGVAEEDRARIFEPFVRVEGTTVEGSGLGLALVAQQAGHHGASVELDASPELGGARFRVRFDRRRD
ncbi:MAG: HAMP domain-containing histidine kinase [Solirubrobacterales bacterium]|nr:HAMP domain-containing histidine kinase [Solirubrobacterales bacterium]